MLQDTAPSHRSVREIRRGHHANEGRVQAIMSEIRAALTLVADGEDALVTGNFRNAERLHLAAQRSCEGILQQICAATEEEAASVEPVFTEFEERLLALARCIGLLPQVK